MQVHRFIVDELMFSDHIVRFARVAALRDSIRRGGPSSNTQVVQQAARQVLITAAVDADAVEASLISHERQRLNRAATALESKLQSEEHQGMLASVDAAVNARLNVAA